MTRLKSLLTAFFESLAGLVRPGWLVLHNTAVDRSPGLKMRRQFIAPQHAAHTSTGSAWRCAGTQSQHMRAGQRADPSTLN